MVHVSKHVLNSNVAIRFTRPWKRSHGYFLFLLSIPSIQNSNYAKSTVNSIYMCTYILINIQRVSKYSVSICRLRVVITCWSWGWSNRTTPSKWVGLGSPLAACSVYGDLTCSVHTVNNLSMFNCQCHFYLCNRGPFVRLAFLPICFPLEIKILLLL